VKIAFLFFLLITHWCGAPASWAARHTTVCLDKENDFLIVEIEVVIAVCQQQLEGTPICSLCKML